VEVKFPYSCEDAAVVHVIFELRPVLVIEGPEYVIHKLLHYGGAVSGSKWHYSGHIKPIRGFECQNVLRLFFDHDIIVTFVQVKLAKEYRSNCVFEYGGDLGQGADIFDCDCVDLPVVE